MLTACLCPFTNYFLTSNPPGISINNEALVVEIHNDADSNLYAAAGWLSASGTVNFNSTQLNTSFNNGSNPQIAINDNNVLVEVHQGPFSLWCHVGSVAISNNPTISWGNGNDYDDNSNSAFPSVAINNSNVVVETHQGGGNVWHYVGVINESNQTINFGESVNFASGSNPSIAINDNNIAVIVYADDSSLNYAVGNINVPANNISFGNSIQYDSGAYPRVAITNDNYIIELHQSQGDSTLWYRLGQINTEKLVISWLSNVAIQVPPSPEDGIITPALAIQTNQNGVPQGFTNVIAACQSLNGYIQYAASKIWDRSIWMSQNYSTLSTLKLNQICLPGSHDAGMSVLNNHSVGSFSGNTQTQFMSINEQLNAGARFFDCRPVIDEGNIFYLGHWGFNQDTDWQGADGELLSQVCTDIISFLQSPGVTNELIILDFSHYLNVVLAPYSGPNYVIDSKDTTTMLNVLQALNPYIYVPTNPSVNLATLTLAEIMGTTGSKVILLFEPGCDFSQITPATGLFQSTNLLPQIQNLPISTLTFPDAAPSNYEIDQAIQNYYSNFSDSTSNISIYNNYANSNDSTYMPASQNAQMMLCRPTDNVLFLYSYTLTQQGSQVIFGPSIYECAVQINNNIYDTFFNLNCYPSNQNESFDTIQMTIQADGTIQNNVNFPFQGTFRLSNVWYPNFIIMDYFDGNSIMNAVLLINGILGGIPQLSAKK